MHPPEALAGTVRRMRRTMALAVTFLMMALASPANADQANYYGKEARTVAKDADCLGTYKPDGPSDDGDYYLGGGCTVGKVKLLMMTFHGPGQQAQWKVDAVVGIKLFYPPGSYYFAMDKGAIIANKAFGRKAAVIAKRRLNASIVRVHVE